MKSLDPGEYVPERSFSDISELGPLTPFKGRETTIWSSPLTPRSPLPPIPRSPRVPRTSPDPRISPEPRTSPEHYTYPEVYTHSGAYTPEHTPVEPYIPPLQCAEYSELTELRKTKSEETDTPPSGRRPLEQLSVRRLSEQYSGRHPSEQHSGRRPLEQLSSERPSEQLSGRRPLEQSSDRRPIPQTPSEPYTSPELYTHSEAYTPEHAQVEPFIPPLQGAECSELTELRKTKSEETYEPPSGRRPLEQLSSERPSEQYSGRRPSEQSSNRRSIPRTPSKPYTSPELYTHSGAYTPEHTPVERFVPPLQGAESSELTELRKTKSEETDKPPSGRRPLEQLSVRRLSEQYSGRHPSEPFR